MTDPTLLEVAATLYSGPPDRFVASRNAFAKESSDPDLADRIKALKKPSMAAWVVNLFARERAAQLGEALQLAQELREAQEDLDAATLAKLGRERRALTQRLAAEAASLASSRGERITPATAEAVRQTIAAAFFDPDAAAAVASGRLIRDLDPSGDVDLRSIVAGGVTDAPPSDSRPVDEVQARRERREAERVVRDAEQALARAERAHQAAQKAVRELDDRDARLAAQIEELEEQLSRARASRERTETDAATAQEHLDATTSDTETAASALSVAQQRLNDL